MVAHVQQRKVRTEHRTFWLLSHSSSRESLLWILLLSNKKKGYVRYISSCRLSIVKLLLTLVQWWERTKTLGAWNLRFISIKICIFFFSWCNIWNIQQRQRHRLYSSDYSFNSQKKINRQCFKPALFSLSDCDSSETIKRMIYITTEQIFYRIAIQQNVGELALFVYSRY